MITFEWKGIKYRISNDAYHRNYMMLPNGVLLHVTGWLESFPPQPAEISEVPYVAAEFDDAQDRVMHER